MMKSYEDVVAFNKENLDAAVAAGTTFAKGVEELSKEYMAVANKSFDTAVEASKAVASCKTPQELSALQQKLAKEGVETAVADSKKLAEMASSVLKTSFEPVTARAKVAFEGMGIKAA
ncbi:MAG: phasin family protein [Rhodospirillaceae bacterium]